MPPNLSTAGTLARSFYDGNNHGLARLVAGKSGMDGALRRPAPRAVAQLGGKEVTGFARVLPPVGRGRGRRSATALPSFHVISQRLLAPEIMAFMISWLS